jgi:hypothetical protein
MSGYINSSCTGSNYRVRTPCAIKAHWQASPWLTHVRIKRASNGTGEFCEACLLITVIREEELNAENIRYIS